jgi:hypothetical protein
VVIREEQSAQISHGEPEAHIDLAASSRGSFCALYRHVTIRPAAAAERKGAGVSVHTVPTRQEVYSIGMMTTLERVASRIRIRATVEGG